MVSMPAPISAAAQERVRHLAVKAVLAGKKQVEVVRLFGVTRHAVGKWVKAYHSAGAKGLKAKLKEGLQGRSLLPWQAAQITSSMLDYYPDQLKLPFYLWTREAVSLLIRRRFGIRQSVWTIERYLSRWGFTPQKLMRRAFEQKPGVVRRWLEVEYPKIRKTAKREKAHIYWGDEMGLRSDHDLGRSYGLRGQTPVIAGTGRRSGGNMISAITNLGRLNFMVFKERFEAEVFLEFLRRLMRQSSRKVFLIVDRHPLHRSRMVKNWLAENAQRIRLFFLPGYSPELNPDEMLNQDVKSNAVGRKRAANLEEMLETI